MAEFKILQVSEDSLSVIFEQRICPEINAWISRICASLKSGDIAELVPAYCSLSVYFKTGCNVKELIKLVEKTVLESENSFPSQVNSVYQGKIHEIPVCYEGEFAPDLQNVCDYTGLSAEEVISIHSGTDYLIYMLGFLPGFTYLGGMDSRLKTPRLETPRTKIPAGSVAIGGAQTGIYPVESPGGWQIIGRTPVKTFDPERNPSVFFGAGDKIRFVPVGREEFERLEKENAAARNTGSDFSNVLQHYICTAGVKILSAGVCTTVQDFGRTGFQKTGASQNGAMDIISYQRANMIAGNTPGAAVLETTLCGPEIFFTTDASFAICGADIHPELNGEPVQLDKKIDARAGSILKTGFAGNGLRSYIAFTGGILERKIFGSCSTSLKCKFGGHFGRKLEKGDELAIGAFFAGGSENLNVLSPVSLPLPQVLVLNCMPASQFESFSADVVERFTATEWVVAPDSDRMGIRLFGPSLECGSTDIISDGIPFGSVQITSKGLPVIMAADRQTCGGYAKIVTVCKKDMCFLAQAVPGTKVKFRINK